MITELVDGGKVLLSELRWNNTAEYDTITALADSLRSANQLQPIIIDQFGNVLPGGGAKRCEAARRLGWGRVWVEVRPQ